MKAKIYIFIKGIIAGMCIGIGGFLFLNGKSFGLITPLAACLFPIGLILICNFDFFLYTGKICYLPLNIKNKNFLGYCLDLLMGLVGNSIGAILIALVLRFVLPYLNVVNTMVDVKLAYEWWQVLILGFFCGVLIYFAVEGFKSINNNFGKYIVLILCVVGFIIAGFEHSIADIFYFAYAKSFNFETLVTILLIILGNTFGGMFIPFIKIMFEE